MRGIRVMLATVAALGAAVMACHAYLLKDVTGPLVLAERTRAD